uniref:Uncharacterized protein n=1 Tax=Rhizophora mucronata TaxID=61149 RepID=A0A2P2Q6N8_RHIMU
MAYLTVLETRKQCTVTSESDDDIDGGLSSLIEEKEIVVPHEQASKERV